MALGRRKSETQDLWVSSCDLPQSPGHAFYLKLNRLLDEAGFDGFVEKLCKAYYAERLGRPGIPPGVYFRMLFIGYMEGLDSQRGIAWRCSARHGGFAVTFRSERVAGGANGWTSRRHTNVRSMGTVGESGAIEASGWAGCEVSMWSAVSPTCARRAVRDGVGFAVWRM